MKNHVSISIFKYLVRRRWFFPSYVELKNVFGFQGEYDAWLASISEIRADFYILKMVDKINHHLRDTEERKYGYVRLRNQR